MPRWNVIDTPACGPQRLRRYGVASLSFQGQVRQTHDRRPFDRGSTRSKPRSQPARTVPPGAFATIAAIASTGLAASASEAQAAAITDTDILNFALNFEYLGAEYYLRAFTGQGIADPTLLTGTGTQGSVTGGSLVPWGGSAIQQYAQRFAVDELAHVQFLRAVLGGAAIAEPAINLSSSWTTFAIAAGLIVTGQTFNPFADPVSFLLGAYVLEDVCVTALAGSAALLTNPTNIAGAAGLLGTEGYQAGAIRTLLSDLGAGQATNAISNLRATLSAQIVRGQGDDVGTLIPANAYNFVPDDSNALAFRRTPAQVLNIAYGGGPASNYAFFPNEVNGNIQLTY